MTAAHAKKQKRIFCPFFTTYRISSFFKGDNQIRTGAQGVADPCLTTWLCRHH